MGTDLWLKATSQTGITGKSLRIIRNRVNPANQKYSAFVLTQISRITPRLTADEGRFAIVTNVR
jgi:hypothetical protein